MFTVNLTVVNRYFICGDEYILGSLPVEDNQGRIDETFDTFKETNPSNIFLNFELPNSPNTHFDTTPAHGNDISIASVEIPCVASAVLDLATEFQSTSIASIDSSEYRILTTAPIEHVTPADFSCALFWEFVYSSSQSKFMKNFCGINSRETVYNHPAKENVG